MVEAGTVLSQRYLIERAIGRGGMSTVFSALDRHRMHGPADDAKVAVKVLNRALLNDKARVTRLIREFRYMQRLTHRGIVRVFDLDCDEDTWFITMELLRGQPLVRRLRDHPQGLPADEALRLLTECTEALVWAHDHGVIHGDLKPGNIFVDTNGAARLLDFGSVPDKDESSEATHGRFLTPAYASPQMLEQQPADLRDDLFSLGCVAYELFAGQHPFRAKSSLEAREEGWRPVWTPTIPARHFGVIARMLAWDRDERPANGREFLDSLTAAQVRASQAYSREQRPPLSDPPSSRRRTTGTSRTRPPERKPVDARRESRIAATPEELSRAFAQFAGKVPEGWVGAGEECPVAKSASAGIETPATPRPAADESARERWGKAIPPEWLEPKPKLDESAPALPVTEVSTAQAESQREPQETAPAAPRAIPWLSQLRWNNARVLKRIRQTPAPPTPGQTVEPEPAPVSAPRAAIVRKPALQWRSSTPIAWNELVSRLRTLRVRTASHTSAPALATAAAGTPSLQREWIPQLHWQDQVALRWTQLQPAAAPNVHPQVHIGTLLAPAMLLAAHDRPRIPPAAPRVDWDKVRAAVSRAQALSQQALQMLAARSRQSWQALAARVRRPETLNLLPHWIELRNRIGALTSTPPRERQSFNAWLTQRAPRWREAVPATAIVGVGFVAWGVLQVSDASRSINSRSVEREHYSAQRLQALAESPVEIASPTLEALPMPVLPVEPRASVPAAAGRISFQSARVRVSAGQRMAVVNLHRNQSTRGVAPFAWRIAPGTARPGVDYEQSEVQMARFNDGQDVRSLFIPLRAAPPGRPERHFTIQLMKTPGGPAFGKITETEVVIEGTG